MAMNTPLLAPHVAPPHTHTHPWGPPYVAESCQILPHTSRARSQVVTRTWWTGLGIAQWLPHGLRRALERPSNLSPTEVRWVLETETSLVREGQGDELEVRSRSRIGAGESSID